MAKESVEMAIKALERAINEGEHTCNVHVEHLGDAQEVSFALDGEEEPVATFTVYTGE